MDWEICGFIAIPLLFFFFIIIIGFSISDGNNKFEKWCKEECKTFHYNFYKIDTSNFFKGNECWCLDEQAKPINIGGK